ncbi:MAG: hypothetical protein EXS59_01300 [Candidatus Taylorbacteria bacterium]|nr:hypothetical protein [Candidatus Taylorbacteria bacterium]
MAEYKKKPIRSADWNYGGSKWKLSRSKIDLFTECPRCFYVDNKYGVARPRGPAFTLNIAVDGLLKKEFDAHRAKGTPHPLMEKYGIDAVPFADDRMSDWRENFVGIQYPHKPTGFLITGAIDDVWVNPKKELIVVDYKATSKDGKIESLSDSGWDEQYKRQIEIYQWLLRESGNKVSETGYFVYVNGKKDAKAFDGKLEFDITLISHKGKTEWIEGVLADIKKCLDGVLPSPDEDCDYCTYRKSAAEVSFKKKDVQAKLL